MAYSSLCSLEKCASMRANCICQVWVTCNTWDCVSLIAGTVLPLRNVKVECAWGPPQKWKSVRERWQSWVCSNSLEHLSKQPFGMKTCVCETADKGLVSQPKVKTSAPKISPRVPSSGQLQSLWTFQPFYLLAMLTLTLLPASKIWHLEFRIWHILLNKFGK